MTQCYINTIPIGKEADVEGTLSFPLGLQCHLVDEKKNGFCEQFPCLMMGKAILVVHHLRNKGQQPANPNSCGNWLLNSYVCVCAFRVWQYFYNPETCQFLYWNYETQSYHPLPADVTSTAPTETVSAEQTASDDNKAEKLEESIMQSPTASEDKTKKEKAMHAKKIVKVCN